MDILVNVVNQKLKITTNLKDLVAGTQNFIRFVFNLTSEWDNLSAYVQFSQDGHYYNVTLDEDNSVYLPAEIGAGECTMVLAGTGSNVIAVTNYLILTIDNNILVTDVEET